MTNLSLILMLMMQLLMQPPSVKPDDPRPPFVNVRMTPDEIKNLHDAEAAVDAAQSALDKAKHDLDVLTYKTIEAHRAKDMPVAFCSSVGYQGHIERSYVVWVLGVVECKPM